MPAKSKQHARRHVDHRIRLHRTRHQGRQQAEEGLGGWVAPRGSLSSYQAAEQGHLHRLPSCRGSGVRGADPTQGQQLLHHPPWDALRKGGTDGEAVACKGSSGQQEGKGGSKVSGGQHTQAIFISVQVHAHDPKHHPDLDKSNLSISSSLTNDGCGRLRLGRQHRHRLHRQRQ